jgi:hypothetical protein
LGARTRSEFKAVNHRNRNFTPDKMKTRVALIEQSICSSLIAWIARRPRGARALQHG